MAKKPNIRPIQGQQRPLTEEEKKFQVMRFLQQKRETFAINILVGLVQGKPGVKNEDLIDKAVALADALIEKLYPLPEEDKANK